MSSPPLLDWASAASGQSRENTQRQDLEPRQRGAERPSLTPCTKHIRRSVTHNEFPSFCPSPSPHFTVEMRGQGGFQANTKHGPCKSTRQLGSSLVTWWGRQSLAQPGTFQAGTQWSCFHGWELESDSISKKRGSMPAPDHRITALCFRFLINFAARPN